MRKIILRRLLQNIVLVVVIVLVVFVLMRLTAGDPARMKAPVFASDQILQSYREQFGTDKPLTTQLWDVRCRVFPTAISAPHSAINNQSSI